ncbi:MAG: cbb3-type cytochrome c oxidase subunit 3 [Saprospiraceae bacterium]|nr:cbb3-type cytochrome c oxidase subunit 3 [Saprospiraceae bacterium]
MKFKNYLTAIEDVSIYPLISLVLFVGFFCGVVFYVYKMKKSLADDYGQIPLK